MKKILLLFLVSAMLPVGAFAKCNGDDIRTDALGKRWGCNCDGGDVDGRKQRNEWILGNTPGTTWRCSAGKIPILGLFKNDQWVGKDSEDGICAGEEKSAPNAAAKLEANEGKYCWEWRCPSGTYFQGATDGTVSRGACSACGYDGAVQDGVCWKIECDGIKNGTEVIYNGKCMPVCDLKTAGAEYTSDPSYISIKIKGENAGSIGEIENENTSCHGIVHATVCSNGVAITCESEYKVQEGICVKK